VGIIQASFGTDPISVSADGKLEVVAADDISLTKYFEITLGASYTSLRPKVGNLRIQDTDDGDDSDYFEVQVDDGDGVTLLKSPNVYELQNSLIIPNTYQYGIKDSGGTARNVIGADGFNQMTIGAPQFDLIISSALVNNSYLKAKDSGGTTRNLIGIDGSDFVQVGNATNDVYLNSGSFINAGQRFKLVQGKDLIGEDSLFNTKSILKLNSATDVLEIGDATIPLKLLAAIKNAEKLQWLNSGATAVDILYMDGSDNVYLGNDATVDTLYLKAANAINLNIDTTIESTLSVTGGSLRVDNNKEISAKHSGGTYNELFKLDGSDVIQVAAGADVLSVRFGKPTLIASPTGDITTTGNLFSVSDTRNHDDLGADTHALISLAHSGAWPGTNASNAYLANFAYTGTIGASGANATFVGLNVDLSGATLTAGVMKAGVFKDIARVVELCNGTQAIKTTGNAYIDGFIGLTNNKFIEQEDSGTTTRNLIGIDGSDLLKLGDANIEMIVYSPIANDFYIRSKEAGGTSRQVIGINASDQIVIGDASLNGDKITCSNPLDTSSDPQLPKIYNQAAEPDIPNNSWAFWVDSDAGPQYWLILDVGGTQFKVQLT